MESLKEAVEEGLTRAVGVSNFSKEQVSHLNHHNSQGFKFSMIKILAVNRVFIQPTL